MKEKDNNLQNQSRNARITPWVLSHLKIATLAVAGIILLLGVFILYCSKNWDNTALFSKDFLVNLAAGFFEIGIGIALAVGLTHLVTKSKFLDLSRPTLRLIQSLRISGRLVEHAAQNSVVFAVALLSENNVSKSLRRDEATDNVRCPICTLDVEEKSERCSHCHLPKIVWNDAELVAIDEKNEVEKSLGLASKKEPSTEENK